MAVASLVLGILGLSGWIPVLGVLTGSLTALGGLSNGISAIRKSRGKREIAIAGIILSCLGLIGVIVNAIVNWQAISSGML